MKKQFVYQEIECKSAMNHLKSSRLPYSWDLNIYRGCEHNCQYCFAMYTHQYMGDTDFFHHIYIKKNIVAELEKKLSSKSWKKELINLGGVTDNYQPVEATYQLMPEILKKMIQYQNPITISTKSSLILRDLELIKELSEVTTVNIAFTITTLDCNLAAKIEPGASSPEERVKALKKFKEDTKAVVGIHMMPLIPYLTATRKNMEQLFQIAQEIGVDYCIPSSLSLRGITRKSFLAFLKENYPTIYPKLLYLYNNRDVKREYKKKFYQLLRELSQKYNISFDYKRPIATKLKECSDNQQLTLFELED